LLSLFGTIAVAIAMVATFWQLHNARENLGLARDEERQLRSRGEKLKLENEQRVAENVQRAAENRKLQEQATEMRSKLEGQRTALEAVRSAVTAFHASKFDLAVKSYDEALKADPENPYVQKLRAYSLFRLNRVDEAIAAELQALEGDKNYARGYFDLARFYCKRATERTQPEADAQRQDEEKALEAIKTMLHLDQKMSSEMRDDSEFMRYCGHILPL